MIRSDRNPVFLASCLLSIVLGAIFQAMLPIGLSDVRAPFYGARALLRGEDPYNSANVLKEFSAERTDHLPDTASLKFMETTLIYPPTTLALLSPLALLPWSIARVVWFAVLAAALIVPGFFLLRSWSPAPRVTLALVCLVAANCMGMLIIGNAAVLSVATCVLGAWCFAEDRYPRLAVLLMAVSLAIKPHNAGLVWLFFLLAGGVARKRALQALGVTVLLGIPAALWVTVVSPHWMRALQSNLAACALPGNPSYAGPTAPSFGMIVPIIDLQTIVALVRDEPRFEDTVAYGVVGVLTAILMWATLRGKRTRQQVWLGLAVAVPLTMLVTYHRTYDAKLLLLAIPACTALWAGKGVRGWLALVLTSAALVSTADIPLFFLAPLMKPAQAAGLSWVEAALLLRPIPLMLLLLAVFYLAVYVQETRGGSCEVSAVATQGTVH